MPATSSAPGVHRGLTGRCSHLAQATDVIRVQMGDDDVVDRFPAQPGGLDHVSKFIHIVGQTGIDDGDFLTPDQDVGVDKLSHYPQIAGRLNLGGSGRGGLLRSTSRGQRTAAEGNHQTPAGHPKLHLRQQGEDSFSG